MEKNEKDELKLKFNELIDKVAKSKDAKLYDELKNLNNYLDKYDSRLANIGQGISRFLSRDIKEKMKKYVNDIIDNFEKYAPEDKIKVKDFLIDVNSRYLSERTLVDKILSVLGFS